MYRANIYGGRRGVIFMPPAIDGAVGYQGQALGLPVWKLLGGGFHTNIRCYASSLFGATPEKTGELRGATGIRVHGGEVRLDPMGQDRRRTSGWCGKRGRARRRRGLLIDAGLVWDAKTALSAPARFPNTTYSAGGAAAPDDYDGYCNREVTEARIAAGEKEQPEFLHRADGPGASTWCRWTRRAAAGLQR
jgi:L-alanine-DL-glutamate epimerase-like enolase superfamily enzyme